MSNLLLWTIVKSILVIYLAHRIAIEVIREMPTWLEKVPSKQRLFIIVTVLLVVLSFVWLSHD